MTALGPPRWDAAISFVDVDRTYAQQIASRLDGQAQIFVYADHPGVTIGTDAVKTFSEIFRRDSGLVVVLYRPRWGETPMTKVEEEAIDSRRIEQGNSDFLVVVKMEPCQTPAWFPAARIYGQWSQLGVRGTADVVRARLVYTGKRIPPETPANRSRRMREQQAWEQKRRDFLYGGTGRHAADEESAKVFTALETGSTGIEATFESDGRCAYVVRARGIYATIAITSDRSDRQLLAQIWDGEYWGMGMNPVGTVKKRVRFTFDLEAPDAVGWRVEADFYRSEAVADAILGWVLDAAEDDERRERERLRRKN